MHGMSRIRMGAQGEEEEGFCQLDSPWNKYLLMWWAIDVFGGFRHNESVRTPAGMTTTRRQSVALEGTAALGNPCSHRGRYVPNEGWRHQPTNLTLGCRVLFVVPKVFVLINKSSNPIFASGQAFLLHRAWSYGRVVPSPFLLQKRRAVGDATGCFLFSLNAHFVSPEINRPCWSRINQRQTPF